MNRLWVICCNILWFGSCLPGYFRFRHASCRIKQTQAKRMIRLLQNNKATDYGRKHGFGEVKDWDDFVRLPLSDDKDYSMASEPIRNGENHVLTKESVEILQPTSGTSSTPKLIPHTKSSAKEFKSALDAWIADLFIRRPRLFWGPQYWSISPATEIETEQKGKVPVGFLDDAEYFGSRRRWVMDRIMAVPSDVRLITDMGANQYVTLLFLLRLKNLRLISVWHPSFLTILFDAMRVAWPRLLHDIENGCIDSSINIPAKVRRSLEGRLRPVPKRAHELKKLNLTDVALCEKIWPNLQVVSCWRDGNVRAEISELEKVFSNVLIQGKGLLATEGVVSFPFGSSQHHVCAITSHVLEFQDDDGTVCPVWDVEVGKSYCVILTTASGLYRYQLKDRVEITGFFNQAPCLRFLGRAGVVSDCVGEKLHVEHVENIIDDIAKQYFCNNRFVMLVPPVNGKRRRYNLLVEQRGEPKLNMEAVIMSLDSALCSNYHYAHARKLGQLEAAAVIPIEPNAQNRYREFMIKKGAIAGTIKFPALCTVAGVEEHLLNV